MRLLKKTPLFEGLSQTVGGGVWMRIVLPRIVSSTECRRRAYPRLAKMEFDILTIPASSWLWKYVQWTCDLLQVRRMKMRPHVSLLFNRVERLPEQRYSVTFSLWYRQSHPGNALGQITRFGFTVDNSIIWIIIHRLLFIVPTVDVTYICHMYSRTYVWNMYHNTVLSLLS